MNPNGRQSTATQASDQWFDRAKDRLEEKGMLLKDFAVAIGITPGGAGHYLSGRRQPTPAMLKKIADVLDMTPNHLISEPGMDDGEAQAELTAAPGFAERLRQATALSGFGDERGWQQRIAEELGVKNQAIGQWMRGETLPSTSTMLKISRRFGVTLDWLLLNRVEPGSDMDKALAILSVLSPAHRQQALRMLTAFTASLGDPS